MVDSTHPFLSTSSARRTTRQVRPAVRGRPISIHVLREEDDCDRGEVEPGGAYISIHVLREEDDQAGGDVVVPVGQFLSTSSARRTTPGRNGCRVYVYISIHVLREEDDRTSRKSSPELLLFLSTSSARRTTWYNRSAVDDLGFLSTSSARRTTLVIMRAFISTSHFYPRPPRGGRLWLL